MATSVKKFGVPGPIRILVVDDSRPFRELLYRWLNSFSGLTVVGEVEATRRINGLLLANFGKKGKPQTAIPRVNQAMLAEMIGTMRPRVNFFMNKFRKLGFVEYNSTLVVHSSLLNIVLHD